MMAVERRKGKDKPVIRKALVELGGAPFAAIKAQRSGWRLAKAFVSPGPVQYAGPCANAVTRTLLLEQGASTKTVSLMEQRASTPPELPELFQGTAGLRVVRGQVPPPAANTFFVRSALPKTCECPRIEIVSGGAAEGEPLAVAADLAIGVVFCGRQCPGAHNLIAGLSHFLATRGGSGAKLWGFVNGTVGLFRGDARQLRPADIAPYLNSGGMHLLGRSADVIRSPEHLAQAEAACAKFNLNGLVLVGGPVSNSDTALLAEHFEARRVPTRVIGVAATIDGDLYHNGVEASIGFDTASRVYASLVGNLATDAASARKYWCVAASHARPCAVHVRPTLSEAVYMPRASRVGMLCPCRVRMPRACRVHMPCACRVRMPCARRVHAWPRPPCALGATQLHGPAIASIRK